MAFDAATDGGNNGGASGAHTFNHTCTGSDRFLVVAVVGDVGGGADDIIAVFYGADTMALAAKIVDPNIARYGYVYTLMNPASGSNTVAIISASSHYLIAGAASYTGVSQAGQPEVIDQVYSDADVDGNLTFAITPLTADSWVLLAALGYAGGAMPSAGAGATHRSHDAAFGLWGLFDSNAPKPASSYSMTWTYGAGGDMGSVMLAVAPAVAGKRFVLVPA